MYHGRGVSVKELRRVAVLLGSPPGPPAGGRGPAGHAPGMTLRQPCVSPTPEERTLEEEPTPEGTHERAHLRDAVGLGAVGHRLDHERAHDRTRGKGRRHVFLARGERVQFAPVEPGAATGRAGIQHDAGLAPREGDHTAGARGAGPPPRDPREGTGEGAVEPRAVGCGVVDRGKEVRLGDPSPAAGPAAVRGDATQHDGHERAAAGDVRGGAAHHSLLVARDLSSAMATSWLFRPG